MDALTTACTLEMIGRCLIKQGQLIMLIDTQGGRLNLLPAEAFDVEGGPNPDTWEYRLTIPGPSRMVTYDNVPSAISLEF